MAKSTEHQARKIVQSGEAPAAIGPYSQAVEAGGFVFCSGQIALDPRSDTMMGGDIEGETHRVLDNIRGLLGAAALGFDDVVKTTIFLADLKDFEVVNRIYGEHFSAPYPARSTVQVAALPRHGRIEIEVIARRR